MRTAISIALVLAVAACHKTPQVEPRPQRVVGDFAYRMNIGPTVVEGEFSIEKDTVMLDAIDHSCRRLPVGLADEPISHSFSCGGGPTSFRVVIDSKRPATSRWTSSQAVTRSRQLCVRWVTTKEGQQVCAESRKEIYTENVPISGLLQITRIAAVAKP